MHALTGAPVTKCVVSMLSCTVTCVFPRIIYMLHMDWKRLRKLHETC